MTPAFTRGVVTQVAPLTVTADGDTVAQPGILISGTAAVNAVCYLTSRGSNLPPLVFVPGAT